MNTSIEEDIKQYKKDTHKTAFIMLIVILLLVFAIGIIRNNIFSAIIVYICLLIILLSFSVIPNSMVEENIYILFF